MAVHPAVRPCRHPAHTRNPIAGTVIDLVGTIGRHVLANLLPARRLRVCPRIVKRAISNYQGPWTEDRPDQLHKATLSIDILTAADT